MITKSIIGSVIPGNLYKIKHDNIVKSDNTNDNEHITESNISNLKQTLLKGKWISETSDNYNHDRNILGNDGIFITDVPSILLNSQIATYENVKYYGAKLVKIGDNIKFDGEDELPITVMNIGEHYSTFYMMNEKLGGGIYLEYHNNPHFHCPLSPDASGNLILGKYENNDEYSLSAFKIPYGYGIYTPPFCIHNDCFLIGNYMVIYSKSVHYSTVIIRNNDNKMINFIIE